MEKSMFFAFSHFKYFFVTHGHIPAIFNFLDLILSQLSHSHIHIHIHIPKHIFEVWKQNQKFILYYGKVREIYLTSVKKVNILSILGTTICLTDKKRLQPFIIFREILKAVCLSFDLVPKLIQKSFQTREQIFVQCCDTMVGAYACKAS